jgi:hypothetical protein
MAAALTPHRWTLEEYLPVWETGAISNRIELLDGEVWDVSVGRWHGRTTKRWAADDVLLVVEVSGETVQYDLELSPPAGSGPAARPR